MTVLIPLAIERIKYDVYVALTFTYKYTSMCVKEFLLFAEILTIFKRHNLRAPCQTDASHGRWRHSRVTSIR